jgi:hypothetical protein
MSTTAAIPRTAPEAAHISEPPRSVGPTARDRWRRWRFPVLMVALLIAFSAVITILQGTGRGFLDPNPGHAKASRALGGVLA